MASRLAIISGGLGGIGTAVGQRLRSLGISLALLHAPFESSSVEPVLRDAYNVTANSDPSIRAYECDITSVISVIAAFSAIEKDIANNPAFPSILVNAAGYISLHPLESTPADETLKHLSVNLLGPMLASQSFATLYFRRREQMMADGSTGKVATGRIVNIASQAAHIALDQHGAYCASKAGLVGLTKCMASEWGGRGIVANTVSPGPVMTALGRKAWGEEGVRDAYLKQVPTGRFCEVEEIAQVVGWLCEDEVQGVNGMDLRVDGGYTCR